MTPRIRPQIFFLLSVMITAALAYGDNDSRIPNTQQMIIQSDTLEINDLQNRVTFTGNVQAQGTEFKIICQKMDLYYEYQKTDDPDKPKTEIRKIVAAGEVQIIRKEGGSASAENAIYFQNEEKIILTGNPRITQEKDFVEGTRITLLLKEKKSIVEGSEGTQVKAVVRIPESE